MLKNDPESLMEDAVESFKNQLKFHSANLVHERYFVRIATKDEKCPLTIALRGLRSKNIDKLVWSKGILVRISTVRPKLIKATFECMICGAQFEVLQLTPRIKWPNFCISKRCKAKSQSDFRLISKSSEFIDWQSISIQEIPEDLPPGRIPRSVQCILTYDLVDIVKPGDRVKIMGVYKSVLAQSIKGINSTLFKTFVDVIFIDSEDKSEEFIDITKEELDEIEKLSKQHKIQKKIARSIAPNIYGRDDLKMACALSLFGGTRRKKPGGSFKRGDIHVLLVGDPGTGKSEILKGAVEVSPRGLYTSGKGSSAVGLTAAVIKDSETGQMNLEAGAIVLANGGVAAIDEFDKMDPGDRSALHEGMEQQSYHYDTEILTTNGNRIIIGPFIDNLMNKYKNDVIQGENCEILSFKNLEVYSTDFNKIFKIKVDRISRHKAPTRFFKLFFTNGRSILITPEHPIFIFRDGNLKVLDAERCNIGDFIPIPKYLPNSSESIVLSKEKNRSSGLAKVISYPECLTPKLSRILGYLVSEGHSYKGSGTEIGFTNTDHLLLTDFRKLMSDLFNILPYIYKKADGSTTLRYLSINLYNWMKKNFPEIITLSKKKRIPAKVLGSSMEIAKNFLISAYKGDGSVESTSIYYRTSSEGLSRDYQDLLLKLGIQSRITKDTSNNSYKVYIRGQSLIPFYNTIIENNDPRIEKIITLIKPDKDKTHHHDIFPTSIIEKLITLKKNLAISYNGYFDRHLKKNHGFTRNILIKELELLKKKLSLVENTLKSKPCITFIREELGFSQEELAKASNLTRGEIDNYERGGYSKKKRHVIFSEIINSLNRKIEEVKDEIKYLDLLKNASILWDRIKEIKIIENNGDYYTPWVYDITVEPNHTFISQGVVLHNTVSIAKAGIVATLRSETAIIAAANPHSGRFDEYKSFSENTRMPPSLLSRFDLMFKVIDRPDPANDAQMAEFILRNAMMDSEDFLKEIEKEDKLTGPIDTALLKKYIKHARRSCFPTLSEEAKERIKEFYLELRGQYSKEDAVVSILARNLDALVRLSEAYAKMALRKIVIKEDVDEIIILFKKYLKDTGYDKETGKFDVDMILVGQSRSKINKLTKFMDRLKEIFEENDWKALEKNNIIQILGLDENLDKEFIKNAIEEAIKEGTLYEPKPDTIKFTRKQD